MALEKKWESLMKVEESIIINRSRKMCSHSWRPVPNDPVWMESVVESVWLVPVSSDTEAPIEWGRRGRIVMKSMGRRLECIDEVIDYLPGKLIAHRTVEGPINLNTACITEPVGDGC
jgi:hypothetical protein